MNREEWQSHIDHAREMLEYSVSEQVGFKPIVNVRRDGRPCALILPRGPGDDPGAVITWVCQLAAELFAADEILIISDTYHSTLTTNPMTGQAWRSGEMEQLATEHNGVEKGWVMDAISLIQVTREPPAAQMVALGYSVQDDGKVIWSDPIGLPASKEVRSDHTVKATDGRWITVFDRPAGMPTRPSGITDLEAGKLMTVANCVVMLAQYERVNGV